MDLFATVDAYCERTSSAFWSEPLNALTNAAFLIAAVLMWRRTAGLPLGRALSALVFAIGTGSFLFHTLATGWASLADVLPIAGFILVYVYASNRTFWELGPWTSAAGTALVLPFVALLGALFGMLPVFRVSAAYWPIPVLILIYAVLLRGRNPAIARGLALGALLLAVSLAARTLDGPLCGALPIGTHWLWHCLNALTLAHMIGVWRRAESARFSPSGPG